MSYESDRAQDAQEDWEMNKQWCEKHQIWHLGKEWGCPECEDGVEPVIEISQGEVQ